MIILSGQNRLEIMSLVFSIVIILLLIAAFLVLFLLISKYYKKCVANKLEDNNIRKELLSDYKEFLEKDTNSTEEEVVIRKRVDKYNATYDDVTKVTKRRKKTMMIVGIVLTVIINVFLASGFIYGIYTRVNSGIANIFGKNCLVIQTGSMETVDKRNTYIEENGLKNQIKAYSICQFDMVDSDEDMELYNVYAFKNDKGDIIVHRLIKIDTDTNGKKLYTFRGDANYLSNLSETKVSLDRVLGEYNNHSNYFFGIITLYSQSNIGMISLSLAIVFVVLFEVFNTQIEKQVDIRKEELIKEIFKE